jgi:hypothetical protein
VDTTAKTTIRGGDDVNLVLVLERDGMGILVDAYSNSCVMSKDPVNIVLKFCVAQGCRSCPWFLDSLV